MRTKFVAWAAIPLLLAACNQAVDGNAVGEAASPEPQQVMAGRVDQPGAPSKAGEPSKADPAPAPAAPMLAYAYSYRLELPADKARGMLNTHQQTCEAAGPALCQVVASTSSAEGRDQARGRLEIRAQPAWLKRFRERLEGETAGAGGKVLESGLETEDLTRSMVDTEAALRAQTALQDRLERLLAERPGTLADALAIEQELARVRGTIDATRSSLEVMRGRVATSKLTIDYVSRGVAAPDDVASPLAGAFEGFLGNVLLVLAGLVTILSFLLPLGLVAAPVVWWLLRRSRQAKAARAARPPPLDTGA